MNYIQDNLAIFGLDKDKLMNFLGNLFSWKIAGGLLALYLAYGLSVVFMFHLRAGLNERKGRNYKGELSKKKFNFTKVDNEKVKLILNSTLRQLREFQIRGKITSVEIVTVYSQRAYTIGKELCYVSEEFYDQALEIAQQRDIQMQEARKAQNFSKIGLLHGIPMSFKDQLQVKGVNKTDCTSALVNNISKEDAIHVQCLREHGGIPFIKSNMPQLTVSLHSSNSIFGQGKNPYDHERAIGGSSGGEGGLISTRCSPVGFGTDTMGSIRNPAHFCGVSGFRPTPDRISWQGCGLTIKSGMAYKQMINPCIGPLAYCVDDLILTMEALLSKQMHELDDFSAPIFFNQLNLDHALNKKRFRIGFFDSISSHPTTPSIKRSVLLARKALEKQGHTLGISIMGPMAHPIIQFYSENYEKPQKAALPFLWYFRAPDHVKWVLRLLIKTFASKRQAEVLKMVKPYTVMELDLVYKRKEKLIKELQQMFFKDMKLDAILCPGFSTAAYKNEEQDALGFQLDYYQLFNLLHMPCGLVPVTQVQSGEDDNYQDGINDAVTKGMRRSAQGSDGLPIGVQLATPKWKDEECLALMKILEDAVNFKVTPERYFKRTPIENLSKN
eukprot:403348534